MYPQHTEFYKKVGLALKCNDHNIESILLAIRMLQEVYIYLIYNMSIYYMSCRVYHLLKENCGIKIFNSMKCVHSLNRKINFLLILEIALTDRSQK